MVVIAIITMAAGLMIPSLTDFFRNRELEGVLSRVTATLSSARLHAVSGNRTYAVVFFAEGARVYDVDRRTWKADDDFNPRSGFSKSDEIHIDFVFARMHNRCGTIAGGSRECHFAEEHQACSNECDMVWSNLPRYEDWWWFITKNRAATVDSTASEVDPSAPVKFPIDGLIAVVYSRDGMLQTVVPDTVFVHDPGARNESPTSFHPPIGLKTLSKKGSDVASALYKRKESADIMIWQRGNDYACFVDLQMSGSVKSEVASAEKVLERNLLK